MGLHALSEPLLHRKHRTAEGEKNKERKRDRETGIAISPGEKGVVFDSELISTVDFPCMITDCKIKSLDLVKIYEL